MKRNDIAILKMVIDRLTESNQLIDILTPEAMQELQETLRTRQIDLNDLRRIEQELRASLPAVISEQPFHPVNPLGIPNLPAQKTKSRAFPSHRR